jgi:glycosyltransferase involved in cell wall biosynthesis
VDSNSTDDTAVIAQDHGAEVIQFDYQGGYPKKRQWALDTLNITTDWVLLLDADEVVPPELWQEIDSVIHAESSKDAYLITKGFHFMGRRFRYGGFSHEAVLLFRTGQARFERLVGNPAGELDMEVHERLIVDGTVGRLKTPLIHEDYKGLAAYIDRHNRYSTWEAKLRQSYLDQTTYGEETVTANLFGDAQERRRFLKKIAIQVPFEPLLWFLYHYIWCLGFLEGRPGLIASQIRMHYIAHVRAKMYEWQTKAEEENA